MFSTCSQSSIFQIHLCYFTLCQFFCQFTLILLYINGVCPFAFCGLVLASRGLFIPLASWWACFLAADTSFPRLLTNFSSNLLHRWHLFTAFAAQTFSWQTAAEQVLAHSRLKTAAITHQVHLPQRKRAHTGSFSQIVSILGEVKLVNTYIRYSWPLDSHT